MRRPSKIIPGRCFELVTVLYNIVVLVAYTPGSRVRRRDPGARANLREKYIQEHAILTPLGGKLTFKNADYSIGHCGIEG